MRRPVPMVDLARRHAEVADEVEDRVLQVLRSGRWVGGPVVAEAEARLAGWLSRQGAVGVASGTDALMLALQAVGIRPGDEVIVPALTFFATAGAVAAVGATPVIADVGEDGLLDPTAAGALISPRTRAVIPVHLFGNRAEDPGLGLTVIDDAAQAIGTTPPPSIGRLTAVSAYPTKSWGAAGDAGFVAGDEPELLEAVRCLASHGQRGAPHHHEAHDGQVGRASRLDAIQAAVLLGHADQVEARIDRRRRLADRYDAGLPASIRPLPRQHGSSVHQYCVLASDRARVVAALDEAGIGHAVYYPKPLSEQPALSGQHGVPSRSGPTPTATHLCAHLLALPIDPILTEAQVDRVLGVLEGATA